MGGACVTNWRCRPLPDEAFHSDCDYCYVKSECDAEQQIVDNMTQSLLWSICGVITGITLVAFFTVAKCGNKCGNKCGGRKHRFYLAWTHFVVAFISFLVATIAFAVTFPGSATYCEGAKVHRNRRLTWLVVLWWVHPAATFAIAMSRTLRCPAVPDYHDAPYRIGRGTTPSPTRTIPPEEPGRAASSSGESRPVMPSAEPPGDDPTTCQVV